MAGEWFDVFRTWFIGRYNVNLPGARFKIGQAVLYHDVKYIILAVNHVEDDAYEYVIDVPWPLVVWEEELSSVERKPR